MTSVAAHKMWMDDEKIPPGQTPASALGQTLVTSNSSNSRTSLNLQPQELSQKDRPRFTKPTLFSFNAYSQVKNAQLLALDLNSKQGPHTFVRIFVYGTDKGEIRQPLINLPLADSTAPSKYPAAADATGLELLAHLSVANGTAIYSYFLPQPHDYDPENETTRLHEHVRKLCIADTHAWQDTLQDPQRKIEFPRFVLQMGKLRFDASQSSKMNPFPCQGHYSVCIAIPPPPSPPSVMGASSLLSPAASAASPHLQEQPSFAYPSTANGGVWILFDDCRWDEDYDDEDEEEGMFDQDKDMEGYKRRRQEAFTQTFGKLSEFQKMQPFDLACITTDWKDLFRPTTTATTSMSTATTSLLVSPEAVLQMIHKTAVAVRPYLMMAKNTEVRG